MNFLRTDSMSIEYELICNWKWAWQKFLYYPHALRDLVSSVCGIFGDNVNFVAIFISLHMSKI